MSLNYLKVISCTIEIHEHDDVWDSIVSDNLEITTLADVSGSNFPGRLLKHFIGIDTINLTNCQNVTEEDKKILYDTHMLIGDVYIKIIKLT